MRIPSSIPYLNSNGNPVSLHVGKGMYCSSFLSFEICSPVSLSRTLTPYSISSFCAISVLLLLHYSSILSRLSISLPFHTIPPLHPEEKKEQLTCSYSNKIPVSLPHNDNLVTESLYVLPAPLLLLTRMSKEEPLLAAIHWA